MVFVRTMFFPFARLAANFSVTAVVLIDKAEITKAPAFYVGENKILAPDLAKA